MGPEIIIPGYFVIGFIASGVAAAFQRLAFERNEKDYKKLPDGDAGFYFWMNVGVFFFWLPVLAVLMVHQTFTRWFDFWTWVLRHITGQGIEGRRLGRLRDRQTEGA